MRRKYKRFIIRLRISNMEPIECAGFTFTADFDSGNILRVELVNKKDKETARNANTNQKPPAPSLTDEPDFEFNIWTKPDCSGTSYQNYNRTWFYFGIRGSTAHSLVKLNIVDLNKQAKMYSQGMVPVTKIVPGNKCNWERIRDRVTFVSDETTFILTFRYFTPDNVKATQYFAFTYPYTYAELQHSLLNIDQKYLTIPGPAHIDDIYYVRECVCKSLEGRRIDLITISSYHNITFEKEPRLKKLFPDQTINRPFKFYDKKVVFVSARVHPGETPASFVFNGFLNLLLNRDNIFSIVLRRLYVFKLIPFLNPDGVVHGHYRTDTRGVNLNRLYLNPSFKEHPSVYAARSIICYHHYGYEKSDEELDKLIVENSTSSTDNLITNPCKEEQSSNMKTIDCARCNKKICSGNNKLDIDLINGKMASERTTVRLCDKCKNLQNEQQENDEQINGGDGDGNRESGLFLYLDLHGHASKKGIFMYGNHFKDQYSNVECMLLPKIMSINNSNFHFYACNFTERNMYLKDKRDGLSREGSGRVAVLKLTGLIRSYTLECNYNTGRIVNPVPAPIRDGCAKPVTSNIIPPKFTPSIYEEAGRALGPSILDLTGDNPNSRIPNSEFRTLSNIREWLKWYLIGQLGSPSENTKSLSQIQRIGSRKLALKTLFKPNRIITCRHTVLSRKNDRKENVVIQNKINNNFQQTSTSAPLIRPANKLPARSKFTTPTISSNLKTKESNPQNLKISDDYNKYRRPTSLKSFPNQSIKPSLDTKMANNSSSGEQQETLIIKPETKRLRTSTPHTTYLNDKSRVHTTTNNSANNNDSTRIKLREICVLKTEFGKQYAVAATYDNHPTTSHVVDKDNLIIEWKNTANSTTAKIVSPTKRPASTKRLVEMATPTKYSVAATKHHHYAPVKSADTANTIVGGRTTIKKHRVRKPLRRLATATELPYGLIKNKKRKKKKAKFI